LAELESPAQTLVTSPGYLHKLVAQLRRLIGLGPAHGIQKQANAVVGQRGMDIGQLMKTLLVALDELLILRRGFFRKVGSRDINALTRLMVGDQGAELGRVSSKQN